MGDAHAVVELEAAFAAALAVDAAVFGGRRDLETLVDQRLGRGHRRAQALGGGRAGHDHLPGLRVAPRGRALGGAQDRIDDVARHRVGEIAAAAVARVEHGVEGRGEIRRGNGRGSGHGSGNGMKTREPNRAGALALATRRKTCATAATSLASTIYG